MYLMYFIYFIHLIYYIFFIHLVTHNDKRRQHKGAGAKAAPETYVQIHKESGGSMLVRMGCGPDSRTQEGCATTERIDSIHAGQDGICAG